MMRRLVLFLLLISHSSFGAPKNKSAYVEETGPFLNIAKDAYVQGSLSGGGKQPDYFIDHDAPELLPLWKYSAKLKKDTTLNVWGKCDKIIKYIQRYMLTKHDYDDKDYWRIINRHRSAKADIPLSRYAACGAGVCREHALLTHFALKHAGVENSYVYAQIHRSSAELNFDIIEDHAFNVIEVEGKKWIVDAYYTGFNGYELKDMLTKKGATERSKGSVLAVPRYEFRNILKLHHFPVWNPKSNKCEFVFEGA